MNTVYISFGGNKPDTLASFKKAIFFLEESVGKVMQCSALYQSEAWGFKEETAVFLNQVILLKTSLPASELLTATQKIEKDLGRLTKTQNEYQDRVIDIDILFFNHEIINTQKLTIPHALLHKRNFILTPLAEISPNFTHPVFQKTIKKLLLQCKDNLGVSILKKE